MKWSVLTLVLGLWLGGPISFVQAAPKDESPRGKEQKHTPPGLEKHGGVPPGQAKKKGNHAQQEEESAPTSAPAAPAPTTPSAPVSVPTTPPSPPPVVAQPASVPSTQPAVNPAPKATDQPKSPQPSQPTKAAPVSKEVLQKRAQVDRKVADLNKLAATTSQQAAFQTKAAKALGVSPQTLQAQQKAHPQFAPGGLFMANAIAKSAKVSPENVITQREQGKNWGEIAAAHNVNLDSILAQTASLEKTLK